MKNFALASVNTAASKGKVLLGRHGVQQGHGHGHDALAGNELAHASSVAFGMYQ